MHTALQGTGLFAFVMVLAFFFAKTEIHIEGKHGWAEKLPTWRIESHPLLSLLWGGRVMTGYHAWVFSFMLLAFHLPLFLHGTFSIRLEARVLGCLMWFWLLEDFLWFVLNPAFGLRKFTPAHVDWHKRWVLGVPADYLYFGAAGVLLIAWSYGAGS